MNIRRRRILFRISIGKTTGIGRLFLFLHPSGIDVRPGGEMRVLLLHLSFKSHSIHFPQGIDELDLLHYVSRWYMHKDSNRTCSVSVQYAHHSYSVITPSVSFYTTSCRPRCFLGVLLRSRQTLSRLSFRRGLLLFEILILLLLCVYMYV